MEARGGGEDAPGWLLLYVIVAPQGGGSSDAAAATAAAVDAQGKIFWWLCADFYAKTPGDRCSLVSLYVDGPAPARGGDPKGSVRKMEKMWCCVRVCACVSFSCFGFLAALFYGGGCKSVRFSKFPRSAHSSCRVVVVHVSD